MMLVEFSQQIGEIREGAAQPVNLVHYDHIDFAVADVFHQFFQSRTLDGTAGVTAVIVMLGQTYPALLALAFHIGFPGFALGIKRIEIHIQSLVRAFAGVDRHVHRFLDLNHGSPCP